MRVSRPGQDTTWEVNGDLSTKQFHFVKGVAGG